MDIPELGAGDDGHGDSKFPCEGFRERSFPESRRSVKKDVGNLSPPTLRRFYRGGQAIADIVLTDEI